MALNFNPIAPAAFFAKVLATHPTVQGKVKELEGVGYTFKLGLFEVEAFKKGTPKGNTLLTVETTKLAAGTVTNQVLQSQQQQKVADWISYLHQKENWTPAWTGPSSVVLTGAHPVPNILALVKAVHKAQSFNWELKTCKAVATDAVQGITTVVGHYVTAGEAATALAVLQVAGGEGKVVAGLLPVSIPLPEAKPTAAQPVPEVVHLKDAKAVGQRVHGTSPDSVYHCIALSQFVRLAARITGESISIRAEWLNSPQDEIAKLTAAGLGLKGNGSYGSIHFDADGVPVARVIGAFLLGTGIKWQASVTSGADLVTA